MNSRAAKLQTLRDQYEAKRPAIRARLAQFRAVLPEQYFYELAYCFMTPQSSAVNASKAERALAAADFQHQEIDPEPLLHQKDYYIRFHRTKARLLKEMKRNYAEIVRTLSNEQSGSYKREWLVEHVKGIGYKEATHFLRNVGLNEGLAILDRHILRNLKQLGIIRSLPKTLTKKYYLAIEKRFQKFSKEIGIDIDELDLLFWSNEAGEILK